MSRDNQPNGKNQPSLLPQNTGNKSERSRILAKLEDGGTTASQDSSSRPLIKQLGVPIFLLAIITGSSWLLFPDKPARPDAIVNSAMVGGTRIAEAVSPPIAAPAVTHQINEIAPIVATAQIVDDPSVLRLTESQITKQSNMQEILSAKPEANAIGKALEVNPSDKVAVTHAFGTDENVSMSSKTKTPAKTILDRKKQIVASSKTPTKTQGDSDIALLTAIVAHSHESPSSDDSTSKKLGKIPNLIKDSHDRDAQVSVVEVSNPAVKEQLLKCKKLDAQEADLCQWRVFSGSKNGDPACR